MENQTPLESQQQVESIQQPLKIDAKQEKTLVNPPNKKKSPAIAILSILLIFALSVVGYFIYGFYFNNNKSIIQENSYEKAENISPSTSIESETNMSNEEKSFLESVENLLGDFNGLPVVKVNDYRMWWVSDDGFSILNNNSIAVETGVDCSNYNYEKGVDAIEQMKSKLSLAIDELMISQEYKMNISNTSSSHEDDYFYDYIRGYEYENGDSKCLLTINPDCSGGLDEVMSYKVAFSCTNDFDSNYSSQAPILKDLQLFDQVISVNQETDEFLTLGVNARRTGYMLMAKKINGKWVKIHTGHESPTCDIVEKYKIPNKIISSCWDLELNEQRDNNIGQ